MTDQTEKLKALALAAEQDGHHVYINPRDSNKWRENEDFHMGVTPAAVLELIAEVERLRAEKESPDLHVIPPPRGTGSQQEADSLDDLYGAIMNLPCERTMSHFATQNDIRHYKEGHLDARVAAAELALKLATRCRAEGGSTSFEALTLYGWDEDGMAVDNAFGHYYKKDDVERVFGSAPAAGTDKDAERLLREARAVLETWKDVVPAVSLCADIDAAIGAHTKAGKPTPKGETK